MGCTDWCCGSYYLAWDRDGRINRGLMLPSSPGDKDLLGCRTSWRLVVCDCYLIGLFVGDIWYSDTSNSFLGDVSGRYRGVIPS